MTMTFKWIHIEKEESVGTIWLQRPEVHNAFDEDMINELIAALEQLTVDNATKILVIRGKGSSFCAGADLHWMKQSINYNYVQNLDDSLNLSQLFFDVYTFPKPTVAIVHGSIFGGGNGLMSACDFVLSTQDAMFALSEVKLGLIPACISPYVLKRTGEVKGRQIMLRGNRFDGICAESLGLVDFCGTEEEVTKFWKGLKNDLISSAPKAVVETKKLIHKVSNSWSLLDAKRKTAEWIAEIRGGDEGQEGMRAFLEKRKPNWIK